MTSNVDDTPRTDEHPAPRSRLFRLALLAGVVVVLLSVIGGGWFMSRRASEPTAGSVTLVSPTNPTPTDDSFLVHLTYDPGAVGSNALFLRLTTWDGGPLPSPAEPSVTLSAQDLQNESSGTDVPIERQDGGWATSDVSFDNAGWWLLTVFIARVDLPEADAEFVILLPDPNTQGFDAPPDPGTNPAAEELFKSALADMTGWKSARWIELIGSGLDVLVVGDFAVTEPGGGVANAYEMSLLFSGRFAPTASGADPRPPSFNSRHSITVGDAGWLETSNGTWLEERPTRFIPPSGWDGTYEGATDFQLGVQQTIEGETFQLLIFHLPEQPTSAEAWFVWWINVETGSVHRINMISRMHYMTWLYREINSDVTIEPPVDLSGLSATPTN